ncbi:MAG: type II secretion system F family protein [Dehalococcoidia bacterium]|nr:MAG: type II secretion system F family protein [Dehalococcoidia bacterium]
MDFNYVAYTRDKKMTKGRVSATTQEAAIDLLNYGGYKVISVKPHVTLINWEKISSLFGRVNPKDVVMFSRQLALLLESGTDIVAALELLQEQVTNRTMKRVLGEVVSDIRGGSSLSMALRKHPNVFSSVYARAITAGEKSGNLEVVLRQMADFVERRIITEKKIKNALTYPIIVIIVAVVVIILMVTFILPSFTSLYEAFGTSQPFMVRLLINVTEWFEVWGMYVIIGFLALVVAGLMYARTPTGRYRWDRLTLRLPVIGRIVLLSELARACRTISLLFHVGLPLPEVISIANQSSGNKIISERLGEVQRDLIRGEGLSKPMAKRTEFLPLMVQMTGVGEETGNLDETLTTVAESYEMEADERTTNAVGLIQPVVTIAIGLFIGFIALTLVQAMYSMYGELGA